MFSIVLFSLLVVFVDDYILFFGQDVEFYRIYVIYGILFIFMQTLFSFVIDKLYFEDKDMLASAHLFAFYLTSFVVLVLSTLLISNILTALIVTLSILFVYIICLYVWQFQKFKIDFSFVKNFKYESANIISSIFMMLIYLLGYRNAFSVGAEYLIAINIVTLCTDTQWDMMDAINTAVKVDISKNRFEYKSHLRNAYLYVAILVISSIIMTLALLQIRDAVLIACIVCLTIQVTDMFLYAYEIIIANFIQLNYSAKINTVIKFFMLGIRMIVSTCVMSPYCTEIGQLVNCILGVTIYFIIRKLKLKVVDGKLMKKT